MGWRGPHVPLLPLSAVFRPRTVIVENQCWHLLLCIEASLPKSRREEELKEVLNSVSVIQAPEAVRVRARTDHCLCPLFPPGTSKLRQLSRCKGL